MNNPASTAGQNRQSRLTVTIIGFFVLSLSAGCVSQPVMTKMIYEDRSAWIRLEINPDADEVPVSAEAPTPPSSGAIAGLLKGFQSEKDYNAGLMSMAVGKSYYNRTFVEPELMVLTPQLAKALAMASPKERVAYCLTADYTANERFITTGWVYMKGPYLHFKLVEWRTPIKVNSPATPTSEACLVKPIPGAKTVDRFFQLDYEPKNLIVTHGPLGRSIYNRRGEVMLKLAGLDAAPDVSQGSNGQGAGAAQNAPNASETSAQPVTTSSASKTENRVATTKEVAPKPQVRSKQKSSVGQSTQ